MVLRRFFEVSWFWAQFQRTKPPTLNSVDDFASLDTPGGPSGVKPKSADSVTVYYYQHLST